MKSTLIANWKMNGSRENLIDFCQNPPGDDCNDIHIIFCPPSIYIREAVKCVTHNFTVFGQDCSEHPNGAYTGDISAAMLSDCGASGTLIGHSERRDYHYEKDETIGRKLHAALENGLVPVVCFGETLHAYEAGLTNGTIRTQLETIIQACTTKLSQQMIYWAYEPRWAIGTGKTPSLYEISHAGETIFETLTRCGIQQPHILYGGSVNATNAAEISKIPHVCGALVGGASLDKAQFQHIIHAWK